MAAESSKSSEKKIGNFLPIKHASKYLALLSALSLICAYILHYIGYADSGATIEPDEPPSYFESLRTWQISLFEEPHQTASSSSWIEQIFEIYIQGVEASFLAVDIFISTLCLVLYDYGTKAIKAIAEYGKIGLPYITYTINWIIDKSYFYYEQSNKSPLTLFLDRHNLTYRDIILTFSAIFLVIASMTAFLLCCTCCIVRWKKFRKNGIASRNFNLHSINQETFRKLLINVLVVSLLLSIPWEFIRLYQHEVAKNTALANKGIPLECLPESMSFWQSVRAWGVWQFSWNSSPCEEYYKALLVDPLWEITPMMVVTSAITRCVTRPIQLSAETLGTALNLLFSQLPLLWQPIFAIIGTVIVILALITCCRYRLSMPFFLRLEPGEADSKSCKTCCKSSPLLNKSKDDIDVHKLQQIDNNKPPIIKHDNTIPSKKLRKSKSLDSLCSTGLSDYYNSVYIEEWNGVKDDTFMFESSYFEEEEEVNDVLNSNIASFEESFVEDFLEDRVQLSW